MRYIDLRSDTVTQPTDKMRKAMFEATVGDDVYGDDPTVRQLEELAAAKVGKEAALFVPSGTMGNQLCIMTHTRRGEEVLTGFNYHIAVHEVGAVAALSQVNLRTIQHENDFILPSMIEKYVRTDDIHEPRTSLLSLENALSNGMVVPLSIMKQDYEIAKELGLNVHLDGARIFNAAAYLNVDVKELTQYCDSVMFCISKGLCSPVGSLIAGSKEFIDRARKNRKMLGGGLRQAGFLAACGLISLNEMTERLTEDHKNAHYLAQCLLDTDEVECDIEKVQINMVFFRFLNPDFDHMGFKNFLFENGIKINGACEELEQNKKCRNDTYRFVTSNDVSQADIDKVIVVVKKFLNSTI